MTDHKYFGAGSTEFGTAMTWGLVDCNPINCNTNISKIKIIDVSVSTIINYNKKIIKMVLDFRWWIIFYIIDYNLNITSVKFLMKTSLLSFNKQILLLYSGFSVTLISASRYACLLQLDAIISEQEFRVRSILPWDGDAYTLPIVYNHKNISACQSIGRPSNAHRPVKWLANQRQRFHSDWIIVMR